MSMGKILAGFLVISALVMGVGLYYTAEVAYFEEVSADAPAAQMRLVSVATGTPEPILTENVTAIDRDTSPISFRACFTTPMSLAMLTETYEVMEDAVPLNGPRMFDCFDAAAVGAGLESGNAVAFMAEPDIREGVDRVIAIFPDGRGYAWHQRNEKLED